MSNPKNETGHPTGDSAGSRVRFGADGGQYLTFKLADEQYGVEILSVQEIKGYSTVTPLPNVDPYVRGVMNLRGTIIPVVDLRRRLGLPEGKLDRFTVIIVLKVGAKVLGLIVDAVSDVLNLAESEIQAPPEIGKRPDAGFVRGIAKNGDRLVMLLDVEKTIDSSKTEYTLDVENAATAGA